MYSCSGNDSYCERRKYVKKTLPKYYMIVEQIMKDIRNKKILPNEKVPPLAEIMKKYGVSHLTASRVMNELSSKNIAYSVAGKGYFVLTQPKKSNNPDTADAPKPGNKRIAFIHSGILDEFYGNILRGILDVLQPARYVIELYYTTALFPNEKKILGRILNEPIAGILFIPSQYAKDYSQLYDLSKKGVPIVLLDTSTKGDFNYVTSDNKEGAINAVNYLVQNGHKDILYIDYGWNMPLIERFEGYKNALLSNNIDVDQEKILHTYLRSRKPGKDEGLIENKIQKLLKKNKISAIFAAQKRVAEASYRIVRKMGLSVPSDISIVAFDSCNPEMSITSVEQDTYNIGNNSANILLEEIKNRSEHNLSFAGAHAQVKLKTTLIVRNSVKQLNKENNGNEAPPTESVAS